MKTDLFQQQNRATGPTLQKKAPVLVEAVPGGCMYRPVNNEPCNEPATQTTRTPGGGVFRYCDTHAEQAAKQMKRAGRPIMLSKIV